MRSPQTIGLEWARPGISTFQRMFAPVTPLKVSGKSWPSATPEAEGPRNPGQSVGAAVRAAGASRAARATQAREMEMFRSRIGGKRLMRFESII